MNLEWRSQGGTPRHWFSRIFVRKSNRIAILASFGFVEKRSRGSHHTFRNANGLKITVPKKGGKMVKGIYVQQIVTLPNLEDWNHENSD